MNTLIPPIAEIVVRLSLLSHAEVQSLSRLSGVPFTTLWKIRSGETGNPGIETVRKFISHIKAAVETDATPTAA